MNSSNPYSWVGFGAGREKLKINPGDFQFDEGPNGTELLMSSDIKAQLYKAWSNALILKIMRRPHTLNYMLQKLNQKWSLIRQWQLTDLEDVYFVARFQMDVDLEYVLTGGPWIISNQYLVVQKWRSNFVPGEEPIKRMLVWIRLSKLPMEWIDVDVLRNIGSILGNVCKVDSFTKAQSRGRFARICVELDITMPLKSSLTADKRTIKVEYESLGIICFGCGKVGHVQDNCREGMVTQELTERTSEGPVAGAAPVPAENQQASPYGP
ncbi:hypothetical protein ACOSP7_010445 [Xanthoceras sorbifolium]